jgi:hypothetical protein
MGGTGGHRRAAVRERGAEHEPKQRCGIEPVYARREGKRREGARRRGGSV